MQKTDDKKTQESRILEALKNGVHLTPLDALNRFGCLRLGARVFNLKRQGWPIKSQIITTTTGKRVAEYWLPQPKQGALF